MVRHPKLDISKDLRLPVDAVTQTFAILAKQGVGKTYSAAVMVEVMLKAGLQVVVVDPVGVWWGLRSSADGQHEGLPIVIMGGEHGDLPLEVGSGELIADVVVAEGLSVVLDLSPFRKGEQTRFMTDVAERLYHQNRQPLHLVLDEADAFAPQRPMKGQERLLGAIEDLVRRGRAHGIGVMLVTQRHGSLEQRCPDAGRRALAPSRGAADAPDPGAAVSDETDPSAVGEARRIYPKRWDVWQLL